MPHALQLKQLSSLAKVLPDSINCPTLCRSISCVRGQEISYQIAYRYQVPIFRRLQYQVEVISPWEDTEVCRVGTVPAVLSAYYGRHDKDYITHKSGIFPDPLIPLTEGYVFAATNVWQSVWISVRIPDDCAAGKHTIRVAFTGEDGTRAERKMEITVYPYTLPEQDLLCTQWFYCDCIADAHNVSVFSEEHWSLIEKYMRMALILMLLGIK